MIRTINDTVLAGLPKDFDLVSDTSNHNGEWFAVQFIEDSVIESLKIDDTEKLSSNLTISAGQIIYGSITDLKLASGTAILYLWG